MPFVLPVDSESNGVQVCLEEVESEADGLATQMTQVGAAIPGERRVDMISDEWLAIFKGVALDGADEACVAADVTGAGGEDLAAQEARVKGMCVDADRVRVQFEGYSPEAAASAAVK